MNAIDVVRRLQNLGLEVTTFNGGLRLVGTATIPADLVAAIDDHKPEILAYLQERRMVNVPRQSLLQVAISAAALCPEDRAALLRLLQSEPHPAG